MPLFGKKKEKRDDILIAKFREYGTLGMAFGDHAHGTLVARVQMGSPAELAGVPAGAFVVGVNGEEVVGMPPEAVEVLVETGVRPLTVVMQKPKQQRYIEVVARFTDSTTRLGMMIGEGAHGGAIVSGVHPGSAAEAQGVRAGSVLVGIVA